MENCGSEFKIMQIPNTFNMKFYEIKSNKPIEDTFYWECFGNTIILLVHYNHFEFDSYCSLYIDLETFEDLKIKISNDFGVIECPVKQTSISGKNSYFFELPPYEEFIKKIPMITSCLTVQLYCKHTKESDFILNSKNIIFYVNTHYRGLPIKDFYMIKNKDTQKLIIDSIYKICPSPKMRYSGLHIAAINHDKDLLQRLLKEGLYINSQDFFDLTPLHIIALFKDKDIYDFLIKNGADGSIEDKSGKTPLDYLK